MNLALIQQEGLVSEALRSFLSPAMDRIMKMINMVKYSFNANVCAV